VVRLVNKSVELAQRYKKSFDGDEFMKLTGMEDWGYGNKDFSK